ncbi:MAG: hypothetical protein AMS25_07995 [Gemmatimonas sp. SM23_52]|nr:MAG: hypothetical protein AMS25_07995 [Gemmatimonas sp. SM23_52]
MQHLDNESIELFLSGELSESEARPVRDHLAQCRACVRRVEAARQEDQEIGALLSVLDHPVPRVEAEDVMRRARRRWLRPRTAAAGIVLLVAAGAASAVPGSPVRTWLAGLFESLQGTPPQQGLPVGVSGGISVIPTEGFELVFETSQGSGVIRIFLTDEAELAVRAIGGGPGYSVGPERVRVENAGSAADYEILVPRSAESVRIRVGETVVFTKQGASITTAAGPDARGRYILDFAALQPATPVELEPPDEDERL